MRTASLVLALGTAAACGARRAPPEPAVAAPLTATAAVLDAGGAGLRISMELGCRAHLDRVEWSTIAPNGTVTDQPPVSVGRSLDRGDQSLLLPWGTEPGPVRVQGTVHGRCALGPAVRYPFSLPAHAASTAPLDVLP